MYKTYTKAKFLLTTPRLDARRGNRLAAVPNVRNIIRKKVVVYRFLKFNQSLLVAK